MYNRTYTERGKNYGNTGKHKKLRETYIEGTRTSIEEDMMNIEDVLPEKKDDVQEIKNYVTALNYGIDRIQNVRTNSEMIPWIKFFLRASIETAKSAKDKFKRALQVQRDYQNYLMQKRYSTETLRKIISYMYRNPVTSALQISEHIKVSLPTVNKHLATLRTDGIINEITGNKRNKLYALRKYIQAFI